MAADQLTSAFRQAALTKDSGAGGRGGSPSEAMADVLAYLAAVLIAVWGVAHALPTRQVMAGLEPITEDNRRVMV
jgi:hypothetical protein